jgi:uncharacterized protein (DUF342 family)
MTNLKDLFMEIDESDDYQDDNGVEVYADSVRQALELAAENLNIDITMLDYEILEKGTSGFLGIGRRPYRVLVVPVETDEEHSDLEEIEKKLVGDYHPQLSVKDAKHLDSTFKIRVTKTGIWLSVTPPKGKGKKADTMEISNKLYSMRISNPDAHLIEKAVNSPAGEPVKLGEWTPNPDYDSSMRLEITEDEMAVFVHFAPPRYCGRHIEFDEVMDGLRSEGVQVGIEEEAIKEYLDEMKYNHPLKAASGQKPRNGRDAYIDYKVRVDKGGVSFEEDESGKVDFRNLELLENVVVGQLLCVKVPAEEGIPGRTVMNRILPAKNGKDINLSHGKGTILSEDGTELTAEINGQVVFKGSKLSVEPVYVVNGDVSLETGNIVFLGSVIISGSVQDNFVVKAAGNIEVKGTVQKAFLEAEGDIVVYQGISGREEAKIESTGGSVYAKFVQGCSVVAEKDVVVPEGILHSRVDAGEGIYCVGRRAKIVGGVIRAGDEVNARYIGADVSTSTEVRVGINPKVLQQMSEIETVKEKVEEELGQIKLNLKTLTTQKKTSKLTKDKEKMLEDLTGRDDKLTSRLDELNLELEELVSYIGMLEHKGKICGEKSVYPGVDIFIKDQKFPVKDEYNFIKFTLEGEEIRLSEYEPPESIDTRQRVGLVGRRR